MEKINLLPRALLQKQPRAIKPLNRADKNKFLPGNYRQDAFIRTSAKKLNFGKTLVPALPVDQPRVIELEPVNRDFKSIKMGCHFNEATNSLDLKIHSPADRLELCIFKKTHGESEVARIPMHKAGDNKWVHSISKDNMENFSGIDLADSRQRNQPIYYGYRAFGNSTWKYSPGWNPGSKEGFLKDFDEKGNRYNPNKVLTDPYGLEVSHDPEAPGICEDGSVYMSGEGKRQIDTAPFAPKSIYTRELEKITKKRIKSGNVPYLPVTDHVIYEAQVRGLTKNLDIKALNRLYKDNPKMLAKINNPETGWKDEYAGTFKGAAFLAQYYKDMGITMIEFLPVMSFQNALPSSRDHRSWGYMTQSFMAPDRELAYDKTPGGPTKELAEMVRAFNEAGVEVCMDVVYNHTGEGGISADSKGEHPEKAKLLSLRGLDNGYYVLPNDKKYYENGTGCGNTTNSMNKAFQNLVVKSLKHFKNLGISAFRFDLAPFIANVSEERHDFKPHHKAGLVQKIHKELDVRMDKKTGEDRVILMAEPWGGSWQTGNFPWEWSEWNDQYRDSMRKAINKLPGDSERPTPADIIKCIAGSSDKMQSPASRSVNFFSVHDGFTLYDVFAFNNKNNPNDPPSGTDDNFSWNQYGGPYDNVFKEREKAVETALSLLMVSAGTPILLYGDERFKSKNGNNNSYNLDKANVLNWDTVVNNTDEAGNTRAFNADNLTEFTKRLINFRHNHKSLHPGRYFNGKDNNRFNGKDVTWYDCSGRDIGKDAEFMNQNRHDWHDVIAFRLDETEFSDKNVEHPTVFVAYNRGTTAHTVKLPEHMMNGKKWHIAINTSLPVTSQEDPAKAFEDLAQKPVYKAGNEERVDSKDIAVMPRSVMVLVEK